jgi:hypothetical protein
MVDLATGHGLEDCFLDLVKKFDMKSALFSVPPVIEGVGGGTGKPYRNPLHRRIKERFRLFLVRNHPKFKSLFVSADHKRFEGLF